MCLMNTHSTDRDKLPSYCKLTYCEEEHCKKVTTQKRSFATHFIDTWAKYKKPRTIV